MLWCVFFGIPHVVVCGLSDDDVIFRPLRNKDPEPDAIKLPAWYDASKIPGGGSIPADILPDPFDRLQAYLIRYARRDNRFSDTMFDRLCRAELRCEQGAWFIP